VIKNYQLPSLRFSYQQQQQQHFHPNEYNESNEEALQVMTSR
jgi:hypothetical protein